MVDQEFDPNFNPFDSDNFEVSSILNGIRGIIAAEPVPEFKKYRNPNAKPDPQTGQLPAEKTVLSFTVTSPDLQKPRELRISAGGAEPAKLVNGRLVADVAGPFIIGKLNKNSNVSDFFANLKAAGFEMVKLVPAGGVGVEALAGADITWRALEKTFEDFRTHKKDVRVYDVPAQFHGFDGVAAPGAADANADLETVRAAILAAVQQFKEIPRSQLSIRVGPALKGNANLLGLLLKDETLAGIPGTTYDKKSIRLA